MTDPATHAPAERLVEGTPKAPHAPLGAAAASGFAWNLAVTGVSRLLSFAAQIVLARYLLREDFGAYAIAMIAVTFAALLRDSAVPQVLIHRHLELSRWVNPMFWLTVMLGGVSGLIMAGCAAAFLSRPDGAMVAELLWVAAAGSPLIAIGVVPAAILQVELRFKLLAQIAVATNTLSAGLSIAMAVSGFGAYSLVVPPVVAAVIRSICLFRIAAPALQVRLELGKWAALAHDCGLTFFGALGLTIIGQSDYLILTLRYDKAIVGLYFFAFNLSTQAIALLSSNLASVLLPTLARLNSERVRQIQAYLRACRVLAALGVPISALQCLLARPTIVAVFGPRWIGSVSLLQILSVGMAFALVSSFCGWVFQAQGRFRTLGVWTAITVVAFLTLLSIGTGLAGPQGTAIAVTTFYAVFGSLGMRVAIAGVGSWLDILSVFAPPAVGCAIAGIPVYCVRFLLPAVYAGSASLPATIAALFLCTGIFIIIYAITLRVIDRPVYEEIASRVVAAAKKVRIA